MARRRSLVPGLFFAALALGAVAWLAYVATAPSAPVESIAPGSASAGSSELAARADAPAPAPEAASDTDGVAPLAERAEVGDVEEAELAQALWVEGRVRFPEGTPLGEVVEVVADGKEFEHRADHRATVAADGRFRVAFAKDTKTGWLRLDAPHLYLERPFKLKPSSPPADIVLEPLLGGRITGVIAPPAGAVDVAAAMGEAQVLASGWSPDRHDEARRSSAIDAKLRFDLRGVPAHLAYHLSFDTPEWVPYSRDGVRVEAGETLELELACTLGARVAGRIVDASEAAVTGAGVRAEIAHESGARRESSTQAGDATKDGTFVVRGIRPGKVELVASKAGYLDARLALGELADGDVRDGVVVRLDSGNFVAGRVTWPDGSPATGAYVQVEEPESDDARGFFVFGAAERHKVDADGAFRITGLRPGPYGVFAQAREHLRASPTQDGKPAKSSRAKGPMWHARADKVPSGQQELLLVLQAGASVAGRVVDDTGAPVASFAVAAMDSGAGFFPVGDAITSRFESDDGSFELVGLKSGTWSVVARAAGFTCNQPVIVRVPEDAAPVTLVVTRCAKLTGVVVDAAGKPVAKALVEVEVEQRGFVGFSMSADPTTRTDARGEFELDDAPSGAVKLTASHASFAESKPFALILAAGQQLDGLRLVLSPGGTIRGELHASLGRDLSGWSISLSPLEGGGWQQTASDAAGRFVFERVTAGAYNVQAEPSAGVEQAVGARVGVQAATFTRSPSAELAVADGETTSIVLGTPASSPVRVSGRVHRGGQPVPGVQVSAWKSRSESNATTGADGRYELVVDGAGPCTFGLHGEVGGTQVSRHVELPEATSFELDFELSSGRIAGRVLGADGEPVANAWVQLQVDPSRAEHSSTGVHGWAQSSPDGAFAFEGLGPGLYQLSVTDMGMRFDRSRAHHGAVTRGGLLLADGGSLEGLEIRLETAASVEGTVMTAAGAPAIGAQITVRDERGEVQQDWWNTTTDGAGRYRVGGLAPGAWSVSARLGDEVSEVSASVSLAAGATATIDLALRRGTVLQVVVEDAGGKLVGAALSVRDEQGREHARTTFIGAGGGEPSSVRRIGPLAPGTYEVSATNHDEVRASERVSLHGEAERTVRLRLGGS